MPAVDKIAAASNDVEHRSSIFTRGSKCENDWLLANFGISEIE